LSIFLQQKEIFVFFFENLCTYFLFVLFATKDRKKETKRKGSCLFVFFFEF